MATASAAATAVSGDSGGAVESFLLLIRLGDKKIKLAFPRRPTVAEVSKAVTKAAKVAPELQVRKL
jgi:hypothetical protein